MILTNHKTNWLSIPQTGVWEEVDRVRSKFIQPVREALETNKLQCKGEMERVKGAGPGGKTPPGGLELGLVFACM